MGSWPMALLLRTLATSPRMMKGSRVMVKTVAAISSAARDARRAALAHVRDNCLGFAFMGSPPWRAGRFLP